MKSALIILSTETNGARCFRPAQQVEERIWLVRHQVPGLRQSRGASQAPGNHKTKAKGTSHRARHQLPKTIGRALGTTHPRPSGISKCWLSGGVGCPEATRHGPHIEMTEGGATAPGREGRVLTSVRAPLCRGRAGVLGLFGGNPAAVQRRGCSPFLGRLAAQGSQPQFPDVRGDAARALLEKAPLPLGTAPANARRAAT